MSRARDQLFDWSGMNNVYFWWGIGLLLMAAETFVPGAFLLWFGFAAAAMGFILLLVPMGPIAQAIVFGVLSLISVLVYRRWFRGRERPSDQPLLNRRAAQLVGRTFPLETPVVDGYGKIRINDALWTVSGDALPAGVRVRVVDVVDGTTLRVQRAE
jgi:inner membrane protein